MSKQKQRLSNNKKKSNSERKKVDHSTKKQAQSKKKRVSQTHKKKKVLKKKKKQRFLIKELLITFGISTLILSIFFFLTVQIPKVEGYSMTPTINDQDRLFVLKKGGIHRFSLVSFESFEGKEAMIRRVIGLPGEELHYKDGNLFVNGEEIPERFLSKSLSEFSKEPQTDDFKLEDVTKMNRVPEDSYFVMGDNRLYATDSRYFGFVKKKSITGVVKARIFPIHAMRQF